MNRRITASLLLYLSAALVLIGGCYDLLVQAPPAHHLTYLESAAEELDPRVVTLMTALLRALGGALLGLGLAAMVLIRCGIFRGHDWAALALALMIGTSEGVNALQMYRVGSPYWAPLGFIGLMLLGLVLSYWPFPVFKASAGPTR